MRDYTNANWRISLTVTRFARSSQRYYADHSELKSNVHFPRPVTHPLSSLLREECDGVAFNFYLEISKFAIEIPSN